jgi:orotidine-5'-phosphate decarboxylase
LNPSNSPRGNSPPGNSGPGNFADSLIDRIRTLGHPLCVGLDPHLDRIPPLFREGSMRPDDPATPAAVRDFLLAVVDRLEDRVAIVKPQSAFFEQLGAAGIAVLEEVIVRARERGLMVLLDAKRGDIGSTAAAYSRAYLHAGSPLAVDALTVNPYLGLDTLEPFGKGAREYARGLFVLVRTSNPGAGSLQDLEVKERPLFEEVARQLSPLAEEMRGPETGWSSLGVVVGATWPAQSIAVREALPHALFLVPGYGAQGGSAAEALCGFVPGPNGLEGGIVSSSRGITFPESGDTNDAAVWEEAIDRVIEQAVAELGEAQR